MRKRTAIAYGLSVLASFAHGAVVAHEQPLTYDRISLSVDARTEVENDLLVAVLFTEQEGQQHGEVAERVNEAMRWAVDQARKTPQLKVQTLQYTTTPVYRNKTIAGWRARQSLSLETRDAGALGDTIGLLQERLSIASITYAISPEARTAAESRLITDALARFTQRAEQITAELGRQRYRIVQIDVSTGGHQPAPVAFNARMQMAEAAVTIPTLESGVQAVTVVVSGTIELEAAN